MEEVRFQETCVLCHCFSLLEPFLCASINTGPQYFILDRKVLKALKTRNVCLTHLGENLTFTVNELLMDFVYATWCKYSYILLQKYYF